MDTMTPDEPQRASDYDDRTTAAVKSVLIEIGQILGSFKGKFAVVGGAVPWLLLGDNGDMQHVGTLDIDLGLNPEALGNGEYVHLVEELVNHGYAQSSSLRKFQLVRQLNMGDGGPPINIVIDFLRPRDVELVKNVPPLISDFAVQGADGTDLALRFYQMVAISGDMPNGGTNCVEVAVCSIPALLAMKGYAIAGRYKQKDAYDIYYCIRNYPEGVEALALECRPLLDTASGLAGYGYIAQKFDSVDGFGPTCVRRFVEETQVMGERTPEQWQQDAFGQVNAWLQALGLR
ncbi:hypothetical protein AB3464_25970 [Pseudomonas asplenii]|uniref:hypothetical protein n=1 Tax=Pseudomonas asplenii TaxID=53407 RepID=UPI0037CBC2F8